MLLDIVAWVAAYVVASWEGGPGLVPPSWPCAVSSALLAAAAPVAVSGWMARRLEKRLSDNRLSWDRRVLEYGRGLLLIRAFWLAAFAGAVHAGGFRPWAVAVIPGWPGLLELVVIAPFAVAWAGSTWPLHRLEGADAPRGQFIASRLRAGVTILVLCIGGGAVVEVLFLKGPVAEALMGRPAAQFSVGVSLLALAVVSVPLFLLAMWDTRPFPEGDLKTALRAFDRKTGMRVAGLRLWETGGGTILNAAITGILPGTRMVFLTRGLVEHLGPDEVLAVYAHEVGHAKMGHVWGFLGLATAWAAWMAAVDGGVIQTGGGWLSVLLRAGVTLFAVSAYVAMSRWAEKDADLYAAGALNNSEGYRETLTKVARLNGDTGGMRSVTHGSVRERISFLAACESDPQRRRRVTSGYRLLVGGIWLTALAGALLAAPRLVG